MRKLPFVLIAVVLAVPFVGHAAVNDIRYEDQWALQRIQAEAAWSTSTGRDVVVAVLDTGVDFDHPDLAANRAGSYTCINSCREESGDAQSHGTHVAGIIAAVTNNGKGVASVAPEAKILSVKVCPGRNCDGNAVERAIRFAADKGAKVINMSLGAELPLRNTADWSDDINYAWNRGSIVVAAAGNDAAAMSSYAGAINTLVVGATGPDDERAEYTTGSYSPLDVKVYAPGGNAPGGCDTRHCVVSTVPGGSYQAFQGTSMAAPHVAGVAAQLSCAGLGNQQIYERITSRVDTTSAGPRLNAAKAVEGLPKRCAANFTSVQQNQPGPTSTPQAQQRTQQTQQTEQPASEQPQAAPQEAVEEGQTDAVAGESKKGPNRTTLNLIIAGAIGLLLAAWFGWVKFKASRLRS